MLVMEPSIPTGTCCARCAQAADAERRRLERDLHDGAQQRLVALAIQLQLVGCG
jgi:signal transduction histidine kinase